MSYIFYMVLDLVLRGSIDKIFDTSFEMSAKGVFLEEGKGKRLLS